jgi:ABC-2 type transport system permease protein
MEKHFRLLFQFVKNSAMRDMEFRSHFIIQVITEVLWAFVTIFSLEMIFYQTNSLGGWSKGEVFLLYGFYRLASSIDYIFFARSIRSFSYLVNSGDFDLILIRPVNTLFISFTRLIDTARIFPIAIGVVMVYYASQLIAITWTPATVLYLGILLIIAVMIRFSIEIILILPIFWLQKLENIVDFQMSLFSIARFPKDAFPDAMRQFFSFVIPILFVAAVPSEILLGKATPYTFLLLLMVAGISFTSMYAGFFIALRHYSSASS